MGNLQAETGFAPNNLENAANDKSGYSDKEFTSAVDNGKISRSEFISSKKFSLYSYTDSTGTYYTYGYGLAQWTFYSRKAAQIAGRVSNAENIYKEYSSTKPEISTKPTITSDSTVYQTGQNVVLKRNNISDTNFYQLMVNSEICENKINLL